jgi:hypothetical protein
MMLCCYALRMDWIQHYPPTEGTVAYGRHTILTRHTNTSHGHDHNISSTIHNAFNAPLLDPFLSAERAAKVT